MVEHLGNVEQVVDVATVGRAGVLKDFGCAATEGHVVPRAPDRLHGCAAGRFEEGALCHRLAPGDTAGATLAGCSQDLSAGDRVFTGGGSAQLPLVLPAPAGKDALGDDDHGVVQEHSVSHVR